jgi:mRNA interferase RelE/StbE
LKAKLLVGEAATGHPDGTLSILRAGITHVWGDSPPVPFQGALVARIEAEDGLQEKQKDRIDRAMQILCADPRMATQIKALRGRLKGKLRLRVGDWRVIFTVDHQQQEVSVLALTDRRDAY